MNPTYTTTTKQKQKQKKNNICLFVLIDEWILLTEQQQEQKQKQKHKSFAWLTTDEMAETTSASSATTIANCHQKDNSSKKNLGPETTGLSAPAVHSRTGSSDSSSGEGLLLSASDLQARSGFGKNNNNNRSELNCCDNFESLKKKQQQQQSDVIQQQQQQQQQQQAMGQAGNRAKCSVEHESSGKQRTYVWTT